MERNYLLHSKVLIKMILAHYYFLNNLDCFPIKITQLSSKKLKQIAYQIFLRTINFKNYYYSISQANKSFLEGSYYY